MTFPNIISTTDLLFATFGFVFMAWPLLLLAPLQGRGRYLPQMIVMWIVCAGIRVFIAFDPKPLFSSLFIHEPLNTILFAVAGVILIVSYFGLRARQRGKIWQQIQLARRAPDLLTATPGEFEAMAAGYFRAQGYQVKQVGAQGDHGVDLIVKTHSGEKWIVQCKRWRGRVGEPAVREFYGALHHEQADKGFILTTGSFTPQARQWAAGKPIALYDGDEFVEALKRLRASKASAASTQQGKPPQSNPR